MGVNQKVQKNRLTLWSFHKSVNLLKYKKWYVYLQIEV